MKAYNSYTKICMTAMIAGLCSSCMSYPDYSEETTETTTEIYKEDATKELRRYQMECVRETRVNLDILMQLKAGRWKENNLLKKWILCVLHKRGLMSLEGVFKLDVALSKIPDADKDNAQVLITRCLSPKAMPPAEIAWNYVKCLLFLGKGKFSAISVFEDSVVNKRAGKTKQ